MTSPRLSRGSAARGASSQADHAATAARSPFEALADVRRAGYVPLLRSGAEGSGDIVDETD